MIDAQLFFASKKVMMVLRSLIRSQFLCDFLGIVGVSETTRALKPHQLPEVSWDLVDGTDKQHRFVSARRLDRILVLTFTSHWGETGRLDLICIFCKSLAE